MGQNILSSPELSIPAMVPTEPSVRWALLHLPGGKAVWAWRLPPNSTQRQYSAWLDICLFSCSVLVFECYVLNFIFFIAYKNLAVYCGRL
jgi:hypothetical protein